MDRSEIAEQVAKELVELFQKSNIYYFYRFLKSPQAKQYVKFGHGDNPHAFYFEPSEIRKACPQLSDFGFALMPVLERSGLTCTKVEPAKLDNRYYWVVSHDTLNINSTNEEIMTVWLDSRIKFFQGCDSILAKVYRALIGDKDDVVWNETGEIIMVKRQWDPRKQFPSHLRQKGFKVIYEKHLDVHLCSHPFLFRESPIQPWVVIYEKCKQTDAIRRRKDRKNAKQQKKTIMVKNQTNLWSQPSFPESFLQQIYLEEQDKPQENEKNDKQEHKVAFQHFKVGQSAKKSGKKPSAENTVIPKIETEKIQKVAVQKKPMINLPSFSLQTLQKQQTQEKVSDKIVRIKQKLTVIQAKHTKLELGEIFNLLENAAYASKIAEMKQAWLTPQMQDFFEDMRKRQVQILQLKKENWFLKQKNIGNP